MIEKRKKNKGMTYRVKRQEGRLTATFMNKAAAELQDALWGRWGAAIPVLVDRSPDIPLTLRTKLLDKATPELSDQLLAELLARHPAGSYVIAADGLTVGEYIADKFFGVWEYGKAPGARSGKRSDKTVAEMKRALNNIVFELAHELDKVDVHEPDEPGELIAKWGDEAWAWTRMDQATPKAFLVLDQKVKDAGVGLEVWRKVRSFLNQMFRYARLDADSGFPEERANPVPDVPAPKQTKKQGRQAYLPETVEEIRTDFLFLAALSASGLKRVRGGDPIETPGGVAIPVDPELALQAADMIEVLAYGGFRPGEALGAMGKGYRPAKPGYFHVDQRNVDGVIVPGTKSIRYDWKETLLLGPLPESIKRMAAEMGSAGLLFPHPTTSQPWSESEYRNFRRRYFGPIAKARGLGPESDDPYALRHVYATVRIAAGHPKPYIDASLGSSLSDTTYHTVLTDLEQLGLAGSYDIDAAIAEAREAATAELRERLIAVGLDPVGVLA